MLNVINIVAVFYCLAKYRTNIKSIVIFKIMQNKIIKTLNLVRSYNFRKIVWIFLTQLTV